jgi:cholesterol transport system auxiliary component
VIKRRPHAPALALLAAALLSAPGCVSLLPKTAPAQLYVFTYQGDGEPPATGDTAAKVGVILPPPNFPRAAAGDQILTFKGSEAAFIGQSRWLSPASALFQDAMEAAFVRSPTTRVVRRTDAGAGVMTLRLDVGRFDTDYSAGAAPTVRVSVKATLIQRNGDFGAEHLFTADSPTTENRVSAIVAAYSVAVTKVVGETRAWVEQEAPAIAARQAEAGETPAPARSGGFSFGGSRFGAGGGAARSTTTTTTTRQVGR